jgi:hypothetical protein
MPRRFDAIHPGHVDIHDEHIREQTLGEFHRFRAGATLTDLFKPGGGREDGLQPGTDDRVIVDDNDAEVRHA